MIEIKIEGFEDLCKFIRMLKDIDETKLEQLTNSLTDATDGLNTAIQSEKETENGSR